MTDSSLRIEIRERELPIAEGDYQIHTTQTLGGVASQEVTLASTQTFRVARDPQLFTSQAITRMYPPALGTGNYYQVLPSVSFSRSTLPWERVGKAGDPTVPWLALLLFSPSESVTETRVPIADLPAGLRPEGEMLGERAVTLLEVPRDLFTKRIHSPEQLQWMSHVQHGIDGDGQIQFKEANILASRFPQAGENTMHLVSLENRWDESGKFRFLDSESEVVQVISLHSWKFTHTIPEGTREDDSAFLVNVRSLAQNARPLTLHLAGATQELAAKVNQGYTAFPYQVQDGSRSAAWYHGPLAPGATQATQVYAMENQAYDASDRWLRLDADEGMYDTSYALAWELGRLLALQNTRFTTGLYQWKRQHRLHGHKQRQHGAIGHGLPFAQSATTHAQEISDYVRQWLQNLTLLEGIPFSYLVPDERMLPVKSLRVFRLNVPWVQALVYGALSLGGKKEAGEMVQEVFADTAWKAMERYSGLIIRSQAVKDYPDFYVAGEGVNTLRQVRLSPDTLLCLFDGTPGKVHLDSHHTFRYYSWPYGSSITPDLEYRDYRDLKFASHVHDIPELVNFLSRKRYRVSMTFS